MPIVDVMVAAVVGVWLVVGGVGAGVWRFARGDGWVWMDWWWIGGGLAAGARCCSPSIFRRPVGLDSACPLTAWQSEWTHLLLPS